MKRPIRLLLTIIGLVAIAACGSNRQEPTATPRPTVAAPTATPQPAPATDTPEPAPATETPAPSAEVSDLVSTLQSDARFSRLAAALADADLVEKLQSEGPYTLFAPPDTAFDALPADALADLDIVFDILLLHVVAEEIASDGISDGDVATSLLGDDLTFSIEGDTVRVNGAVLTETDIAATNGLIHMIDALLLPNVE